MQDALTSPAARRRAEIGRGSEWLRLAALLLGLFLLGVGGDALRGVLRPRAAGDAELNGAGWEGRRLMAQFLWLKTHAVLHAGIEERQARPGERLTRAGEFHQHGSKEGADGDEHGEEGHVLAIPTAQEDFRGPLGDLERAIKPYKDAQGKMYSKDNEQTIPFYRLMTWADPHFIQGYTIGATFIAGAGQHADQGFQFLLEGERQNPDSFEIQTELGRFYLVYKKDYPTAERHLERAMRLMPRNRKLTDLEEDARSDVYHWRALNFQQWGRPADAVRCAREGLAALGADPMLAKMIQRGGREVGR